MRGNNHNSALRRRSAFTVTELMLSVAIMGVIIVALYSVFNQTQRALRSTETQGNVAEKARAIIDIISRELEQAQATDSAVPIAGTTNFIQEVNLMGGFEHLPRIQKSDRPDVQGRTNFLQNIFFFTNHTNAWQAIGYRVVDVTNGVGILQRYETNQFGYRPVSNRLSNAFINESRTNANYHHVADGVIHMAFIPYDSNGYRLGYDTTNRHPAYKIYRATSSGAIIGHSSDVANRDLANVVLTQGHQSARAETLHYATSFAFRSNALPAFIDLEFGILEPEALTQYYLMLEEDNPNASKFLERQVSKVHLFRQRIPIRTAAQ